MCSSDLGDEPGIPKAILNGFDGGSAVVQRDGNFDVLPRERTRLVGPSGANDARTPLEVYTPQAVGPR